jgi:anthranilate phosphoribosyltransferase
MTADSAPGDELREAIRTVARGEGLGRAAARAVMGRILAGEATPAQIGALLMGIHIMGPSPADLIGFAEAMRAAALDAGPAHPEAIDVVGTGGDSSSTINISTAAALVAAACGAKVAKHGNRSITSRCGSADVLEALGIPIDLPPAETRDRIDRLGFGFYFAPKYHPAMRHAAGPRKELGIRTVFNILGPLANPAGVRRLLVGVYEDGLRRLMAEALHELGSERVWVVHSPVPGGGGLDEIGVHSITRVSGLENGGLKEWEIDPPMAGLLLHPISALAGGDAAQNAARLLAVFGGEKGPQREAVVFNAAAALYIAGLAGDLQIGAQAAKEAIDGGRVRELVEKLRVRR